MAPRRSHWELTPKQSIELECARRGRAQLVSGCVALLRKQDVDDDLVIALGGPFARAVLDSGPNPGYLYWLRVLGARGLLHAYADQAEDAVIEALSYRRSVRKSPDGDRDENGADLADLRGRVPSHHHAARGHRRGMAIIHATTMSPGKLALLKIWLPAQPWYLDRGREPELAKAGGFRLDDPQGEVGIEFLVVTDGSEGRAVTYQVPLTYRPHAIADAGGGLIGTAEHGVLGPRWIYDGAHDPVLVAQLIALIQGEAEPQAQSVSNTPDRTVTARPVSKDSLTAVGIAAAASGPFGTDLRVHTGDLDGIRNGQLIVRIHRVLEPAGDKAAAVSEAGQPCLSATWRQADGAQVHGILATAQYVQEPTARS